MIHDSFANERNFVGCLLRSPHELWQVNDVVTADAITIPHHRDIYMAIRDLSERGLQVTIATLEATLPREYEEVGPTLAILLSLRESATEAGSATDYAPFLAERAAQKRLGALSEWIKREAAKGDRCAEEVASEAATRLQAIMATATPLKPVKLSEVTKRVATFSNKARETDVMPGFTTGLGALDEMTGLLMGGDFIGVIGALGDGKSALLAQIGKHISRRGVVLSCHNEMGEDQNGTRALSGESGLTVREIREGSYDFTGAEVVRDAQKRIEGLNNYLYTDPRMTVRAIRVRALQMKQTVGLGAITIDGLKRLRTDTRHRDRWDRLEEITGELKAMALELKVPVLLAVQRTRTARRREDPVPQLDDADAPTLETDADIVLGVFREESWLMMNKPNQRAGGEAWDEWEGKVRRAKGHAKIIALKVRSGQPFETREFKWVGAKTQFEDL